MCVCVCVRETGREREGARDSVYVRERERGRERECVREREVEKDSVCVRESGRKR